MEEGKSDEHVNVKESPYKGKRKRIRILFESPSVTKNRTKNPKRTHDYQEPVEGALYTKFIKIGTWREESK